MRIGPEHLIEIADAYCDAVGGLAEKTLSHRVFGDSKRLGSVREGADITLGRFNMALEWFDANWPEEVDRPAILASFFPVVDPVSAAGTAA